MNAKMRVMLAIATLCAVMLSGCGRTTATPAGGEAQAGLANPAAVYCEEQGGEYEIRTAADGSQNGACLFEDGSECDEWTFYRGECAPGSSESEPQSVEPAAQKPAAENPAAEKPAAEPAAGTATPDPDSSEEGEGMTGMANPASVYCGEQGGTLEIRSDEEGNQSGICSFDDGTECDEWAFFLSECGPGANVSPEATGPQMIYGWYGFVVTPAEDESEGYALALLPETSSTVELVTMGEDVEAVLDDSRDGDTPVHVWGVLTCDPNDRCRLEVTEVLAGDAQQSVAPDAVEGWPGTVEAGAPMAQFDDVFILSDPNFAVHYGIEASDPGVAAELEELRDTDQAFLVYGELNCNVIDVNGCQIQADRIEVLR